MRQWDFIWPTDRNINYSTTHLLRGFTCLLVCLFVCLFGCHTPVFARIIKVAAGFLTLTRHNWCQESFRPWKDLPFSGFTAVPSGNSTCKIREKSLRSKKIVPYEILWTPGRHGYVRCVGHLWNARLEVWP